jgi:protein-tyrosine phosphatase
MTTTQIDPTKAEVPFRILAVCTGNICRSPMVERLLVALLSEQLPGEFVVESAGTGALVGNPIDPQVAGIIRVLGGSAEDFSARQLTPEIIKNQDLVLALTREHRRKVVEMAPAMLRRTFTLREFARLVASLELNDSLVGAHRWRAALPKAVRARSAHGGLPEHDDVIDPYRQGAEVHQQVAKVVNESLAVLKGTLL